MDERWRRGAWDTSEDEILRQAVKEYGYRWVSLSRYPEVQRLIGLGN